MVLKAVPGLGSDSIKDIWLVEKFWSSGDVQDAERCGASLSGLHLTIEF